jgi:transposase, IS5 family
LGSTSSLDDPSRLIDWNKVAGVLGQVHSSAKGEPAWSPLAMFKALLLSVWYDLSDVKLAEALDERASFRTFCGFSRTEATPERTAFVRCRKALIVQNLDRQLFTTIAAQLKSKAVTVKTGTLVDATIIASASEGDEEARLVKHKGYETCTRVVLDGGLAPFLDTNEHFPRFALLRAGLTGAPLHRLPCHPACCKILSVRLRL